MIKRNLINEVYNNIIRLEPNIKMSNKRNSILTYCIEKDLLEIFGKVDFDISYMDNADIPSSFTPDTIFFQKPIFDNDGIKQVFWHSGIKYCVYVTNDHKIMLRTYESIKNMNFSGYSENNLIASISYAEGDVINYLANVENLIYTGSVTQSISENGIFEITKEELDGDIIKRKCAKFVSLNMKAGGKEYLELVTCPPKEREDESFLIKLAKLLKNGPENMVGINIRHSEDSVYDCLSAVFEELEKHYVNEDDLKRKLINN